MAQQTFEELVAAVKQAESRDRRYKDDGKTLTTSAKGALGEMQVMPKTIRDPGFGVTPAKDKSPDEIARVGVDYLQAMKQKYGDTEKALIAYNWGPGSTDKWLAAGADPKKLPAETKTYVERVKGFLGGKDVPRETSVAKKEREPLPASLPPMAQAPTIKPEAAARVASLGPGYQAALALSFLAETDDEEDRKTTITQEYLAKAQEDEDDQAQAAAIAKRQANVFADLSNTTIRSPFAQPQQPVRMAEGGQVNLPMYDAEGNRYVIGGGGDPVTNPFSDLTQAQQAAYYAANPTMAAITRAGQDVFNATTLGRAQNALVPGFQAQQNVLTHGFVPSNFVDPGLAVAADAAAIAAAANAAAAAGGPAAGAAEGNTGGGPGTGATGDTAFAYGGMVRRANGSPEGGEVSAEDLNKPSFGNPNIRKQGEAARRLAAMRDVNTLPDPKTYAAVAGALGTRPDQMGFSVLNPKYKEIMDVANPAFYAGTALQVAPAVQALGGGKAAKMLSNMAGQEFNAALMGERPGTLLDMLTAPAQPKFMFVRARPEAAARHADLQAKGLSPEQIRAQNLTLVDNRGNLLEEISDAPAVLQQKTASVPRMYYDMLKHPELQSIYPAYDMPDVRIGTTRRKDAPLAAASFGEKEGIQGTVRSLPGDDVRGTVRGTLLHEGQHAIQSMEGFTEGANPSSFVAYIKAKRGLYDADPTVNENVIREMERVYPNLSDITDRIGQDLKARYGKVFPSDKRMGEALYRHMPGEVQAELARVRSNLTPDELKATPLEVSMQQLNINPANILEMNKQGRRLDRQIGDLEYDVYGYAQGGPVYRAGGSPKEGERKLDRETMDMLRRQGTSPASLQRVAPPVDIGSSAAGLPGLMLFADPRIDQTNAYGYMLDGGDDTKNRAMAQAMFLNKSRSEDYPDTIAHETEHLLARQNLGSAANINSKFDELIGNKGISRLNFVRDAVKAAPYLKEKYDLQSSYLDPKMFEFQTKFGLGKNLLYEQLASLAALEQRHKIDLTKDPELRKTLFSRPDVRETYNALTGLRQTRLDPRDLPPYTRVAEPGMLDAIKGVFKRAEGGPVYRAEGSPEEGEMSNEGSITVQEVKAARTIFPELPVTEAVYLLRGGQRQNTPQGEMMSGNIGARIPLGKDTEAMLMLAGSRPEGKQDSSKALLAMLNQRMGEGSIGAQMVRPMDAPAGIYAGGVSGSYPVGEGRVMGNVNMMRMPGQSPRVMDYGVGYGGQVGPGELSAMIMRRKDGPYSGQIQYRLPIGRAEGSPEEGEVAPRLTMQQIERLAAQEAAEREAASTPAFIAQKSGIGRKAGPVSQALQSGQGQIEFLKGMTNVPQNILGAPMDISNMIANVYGGGVEKPFMGSEYLKEKSRAAGLGFTPSTDPTLAAFYGAGDLGSNLVNPAGVTRSGVKAAGAVAEKAGEAARDFQQYNQQLAVPGASYAIRNRGTPFIMRPEQITTGGRIIPKMNEADAYADRLARTVDTGANLRTDNPALANWFRSKVGAYLRRDFGTEQDQMVQAADKGLKMHFTLPKFLEGYPYLLNPNTIGTRRELEGFPKAGFAKTAKGQEAEAIIDSSIYPLQLQDVSKENVPPNLKQFMGTNPEMRLNEMAVVAEDNLKLELLADEMDNMFKETVFKAYGEQVPMPKDYILTEDTLKGLTPAQASNRVARKQEWVTEKRGELAGIAISKDPQIVSYSYDNGSKWISPGDLADNATHEEMVKDIGCAGKWCTNKSTYALDYGSGENRLNILLDKKFEPRVQLTVNSPPVSVREFILANPHLPEIDTLTRDRTITSKRAEEYIKTMPEYQDFVKQNQNTKSITEIKGQFNNPDLKKSPYLKQVQDFVKRQGPDLQSVHNLDGINMEDMRNVLLNMNKPFDQNYMNRLLKANDGSYYVDKDEVSSLIKKVNEMPNNAARQIQMNMFQPPTEKALGGMIERQSNDNRRYM